MKRFIITITLTITITIGLYAQQVNEVQVRQRISQVASQMKSMQCDFVQTKHVKMLNDQKVQIKSGQRNSVIDVKQNKVFREIARIMMNSVVGKSLSDTKDFRVSIAESGTEWIATLLPQRKEMKQMFQKVILHFNKQRSMVSQVVMLEKNGDQTVIDLRNVKTNQPLNSSLFVIK